MPGRLLDWLCFVDVFMSHAKLLTPAERCKSCVSYPLSGVRLRLHISRVLRLEKYILDAAALV